MSRRLTGMVLIALVAMLVAGVVPALAYSRAANEKKILQLINKARASKGVAKVKIAGSLDRAALRHSRDMIARDYFSHSSKAGATVVKRARKSGYSTKGCTQWIVGEVIAGGQGSKGTPQAVFKAWMKSKSHRRIILDKRWRDVGIGCARGNFKGASGMVMYTVDFGRRVK